MTYSKNNVLYQDKPKYGLLMRLIVLLPVAFLAASIYLWSLGDASGSLALLIGAFIIGLIFWFVFPRKYQIYEDHLRIVLGGPFFIRVGFQNIKSMGITSRSSFSVNFVTTITRSYVEIVKRKGPSIAITPIDNESFVENANRALGQWLKTSGSLETDEKPKRQS